MDRYCFLFGDSDAPKFLYSDIKRAIEREIERGITVFCVARRGRFNKMAIAALQAAKRRHSEITLLLMPTIGSRTKPRLMPRGFNGAYYPSTLGDPRDRFFRVHLFMSILVQGDSLICYALESRHPVRLFQLAIKWKKEGFINLTNLLFDEV